MITFISIWLLVGAGGYGIHFYLDGIRGKTKPTFRGKDFVMYTLGGFAIGVPALLRLGFEIHKSVKR